MESKRLVLMDMRFMKWKTVKKQLKQGKVAEKKNPKKVWSFTKGGVGSRRIVKNQTSILGS